MSNDEDSTLSVKTPWGSLVKSQGIQSQMNALREDLNAINKRINELEKNKSAPVLPSLSNPVDDSSIKAIETRIDSLAADFIAVNKRLLELEALVSQTNSSDQDQTLDTVTKALTAYEKRIIQVENKMRDLDSKFDKFSSTTLQIIEKLRKTGF